MTGKHYACGYKSTQPPSAFKLQLPSNQSYEGDRESSVDVPCAQPHPAASHVRRGAPPSNHPGYETEDGNVEKASEVKGQCIYILLHMLSVLISRLTAAALVRQMMIAERRKILRRLLMKVTPRRLSLRRQRGPIQSTAAISLIS